MTSETSFTRPIQLDDLTRRTLRGWWADGLWELAVAASFALLALQSHVLYRALVFPELARLWPLSAVKSDSKEMLIAAFVPVAAISVLLFTWIAFKLVSYAKLRSTRPGQGTARYPFWLPVDRRVYVYHQIFYITAVAVMMALCGLFKDGTHGLSAAFAVAPTGIFWFIGTIYGIPRYRWTAAIGLVIAVGVELFLTAPLANPPDPGALFQVESHFGNPVIPMLIWSLVFLTSGLVGIAHSRRESHVGEPGQ